MDIHYSAFISYRHHPEDIKVATEIQHSLERYHIPLALKKQQKKIDKLFRDKEELPITSDLNDDIEIALKHSDFLIVICSIHTKESTWVQKEIETFLKYHERSRVLTVLVNGDPYDVIPDILLHNQVTDPVTGETKIVDVEPLSCDWRVPSKRQRLHEELPRLAAALLFCSYDELRQRQRQYRQRKMVAIFSAALTASLAFSAYFLYNSIRIHKANLQIQENYEEALRNQSRHLASAAQERLDSGDRLTAIALVQAALPDGENQRPFVPEAEYVLNTALGVYSNDTDPVAIGAVSPGINAKVQQLWLSEDSKVLCLLDQRNSVTIWDTQTLEQTGMIQQITEKKLLITPDNKILVQNDTTLYCYGTDGNCLWEIGDCADFAGLDGNTRILAICTQGPEEESICILDPADGSIRTKTDADQKGNGYYFPLEQYRQDSAILLRRIGINTKEFALLDMTTGQYCYFAPDEAVTAKGVTKEGNLLFTREIGTSMIGWFDSNRMSAPNHILLGCYSFDAAQILWETEIISYAPSSFSWLEEIPGTNKLLYACGSTFCVLDGVSGTVEKRCDAASAIIACQVEETYAHAVLEDGYMCKFNYEQSYCFDAQCMYAPLYRAAIGECYAALRESENIVTLYQTVKPSCQSVYNFPQYPSYKQVLPWGDGLIYVDREGIALLDLETQTEAWRVDASGAEVLGFNAAGDQLYATEGKEVLAIDLATRESRRYSLPVEVSPESYITAYVNGIAFASEQIVYQYRLGEDTYLACYTPGADTARQFLLYRQESRPEGVADGSLKILAATDRYAWLKDSNKAILEVELTTGLVRVITLDGGETFALSPDGMRFAAVISETILLGTPGTEETMTLEIPDGTAKSLWFFEEQLLALSDNQMLYRYDLNGKLLSQTELKISMLRDVALYREEGKLILQISNICNIIDLESWCLLGYVENCVTYLEANNQFICKDVNGNFVAFPLYSVEELLEVAKQQLGNFTLSQEQKYAYGLLENK